MSGLRAIDKLADRLEDLDLTCLEGCVGPGLSDGSCVRSALAESRLSRYPHDDDLCRQDNIDAACFKDLCRALAETDAPEGQSAIETIHWLSARESAVRADVLAKVEALAFRADVDRWRNEAASQSVPQFISNNRLVRVVDELRELIADLGSTDD